MNDQVMASTGSEGEEALVNRHEKRGATLSSGFLGWGVCPLPLGQLPVSALWPVRPDSSPRLHDLPLPGPYPLFPIPLDNLES